MKISVSSLRMAFCSILLIFFCAPILSSAQSNNYSLTLSDTRIDAGDTIEVTWEADADDNLDKDWIGLFNVSSTDRQYVSWQYVTDDTGDFTFTVTQAGDYEFRYFKNDGYTKVAESETFEVAAPSFDNYSLTLSDTRIDAGDTIEVTWEANGTDDLNLDWIGLYKASATDRNFESWKYVTDESGAFSFVVNQSGTYEFRYFKNDGYTKVAESETFEVARGAISNEFTVTADESNYEVGDIADAIWDSPSGRAIFLDWIGLYRPGDSDRNYLDFEYVDLLSNREQFPLTQEGEFEFRYFTNNSYRRVATSEPFTVGDTLDSDTICNGFDLTDIQNFPSPNTSGPIIALGDSITFGVGASPNQNYVDELEKKFNISIINEGIPADTTQDVLARLERDVLDREPSTVIILIGGNDELRRVYESLSNTAQDRELADELDTFVRTKLGFEWDEIPLITKEETFLNLEEIVSEIQAVGANTIVVGFDNVIYNDAIETHYRQVAENTDSFYVPNIYNDVFGRPSRMSDLVHPNDVGYEIVADRIGRALECTL